MRDGDLMIVTGDTGGARHGFPVGTEVRLDRHDPVDGWWLCVPQEPYTDIAGRKNSQNTWWVYEADLASPAPEPVTQDEVDEVLASIRADQVTP